MKRKSFKQIPREIKHSYIKHTHAHRHTTNVDTDLTHFKKISKHLLDLNVKCKSNKLLENNKEGNVGDFGFFDEFSNITQNARSVKENKNVEFHFIGRKKTPCSEEDGVKRTKRQARVQGKKSLQNSYVINDMVSNISKELLKLNSKKNKT